jgi:hypothetical protein
MRDLHASHQLDVDFARARRRAFLHDVLAALGGRPNDLIPLHEVRRRVSPEGESHRGVQTVPLAQIVGSTDRSRDFDRAFLPRRRHSAARWKSVGRAHQQGRELPPVELYRVGDVYFVKDGHHRVSVARARGQEFIDAEVVEGRVRAPLYSTMTPKELLLQAEYAEFLRRTDLDRLRPDHDIRPTALGRYDEIWGHIEGHRRWLEEEFEGRPVGTAEAVERWYDRVYGPVVRLARERRVCRHFPGRTEADLYLWLMRRRDELYDRYRRTREPYGAAAAHVAAAAEGLDRRANLVARVRRLAGGGRGPRRPRPSPAVPRPRPDPEYRAPSTGS